MSFPQRFRARCRENRGQALIMTIIVMVPLLILAGLAIDTGFQFQHHHSDQVVADSAALAAANYCAAQTTDGCTKTGEPASAWAQAATIADKYGYTLPSTPVCINTGSTSTTISGCVDPAGNEVTIPAESVFVNVATTSGTQFENESAKGGPGIHSSSAVATAFASFRQTAYGLGQTATIEENETPQTNTGTTVTTQSTAHNVTGSPLAIFAMDSTCGHDGAALTAGSETINGGVFSNGSVFLDPGGSSYESINYGTGSGCGSTTEGGGGTYSNGQPSKAASNLSSMPIPYGTSADPLPACTYTYSGSGNPPVGSVSGGVWSIPNPSSESTPEVYCYSGGTILLTGSAYDDDSYECGSLSVQGGGVTLKAENYSSGQHLLIYATNGGTYEAPPSGSPSASNTTVYDTNGAGTLQGDVDAPNGTIDINSGSNGFTGLLEAQDVWFGGGSNTITGDGPTTYGSYNTTSTQTLTTTTVTTVTNATTQTYTITTATTPGSDGLSQ